MKGHGLPFPFIRHPWSNLAASCLFDQTPLDWNGIAKLEQLYFDCGPELFWNVKGKWLTKDAFKVKDHGSPQRAATEQFRACLAGVFMNWEMTAALLGALDEDGGLGGAIPTEAIRGFLPNVRYEGGTKAGKAFPLRAPHTRVDDSERPGRQQPFSQQL
jgi:hypothetical protein